MKQKIKHVANNSFFKGGVLLFVVSLAGSFCNYLFNVLSARLLGPAGYGEIVALFSYAVILSVPLSVLTTELIKRLGGVQKNKMETVARWEVWIIAKIYRYKLLLIPYILLLLILPRLTNLSLAASMTLLAILVLSIILAFYQGVLQAMQLFFLFAVLTLISPIIKLIGPVFLFFHIDGINTIFVFLIISLLIPIILSKIFVSKLLPKTDVSVSNRRIREVLFSKSTLMTIFSLIGIALISNLDIIYVKKFFPGELSGIYGAWSLMAKIVLYVISPVQTLSLIFFSSYSSQRRQKQVLILLLLSFAGIGAFIHVGYTYFGNTIIGILFNSSYNAVLPLISYAALFGFLYSSLMIINNYFLVKNSQFCLITIAISPLYAVGLFLYGHSLQQVILVNIAFTSFIFVSSLFALVKD